MKVKEWKSWLKAQHSKNEDHDIWYSHFVANRWGKRNSDRFRKKTNTPRHVGSQFPNQGSHSCSLQWKHGSLNPWTTREVPIWSFDKHIWVEMITAVKPICISSHIVIIIFFFGKSSGNSSLSKFPVLNNVSLTIFVQLCTREWGLLRGDAGLRAGLIPSHGGTRLSLLSQAAVNCTVSVSTR